MYEQSESNIETNWATQIIMWVNYRLWPVTHLPCFRHFGELQVTIVKKHTFLQGVSFALLTHLPLWGWWQCGFSQLSSSKCRVSRRGQDEGGSDDFKPNQSKRPVLFDKSTPLVFVLPPSWTNFNLEYREVHVRHFETRSSKLFGDVRDHWDPSQPSINLIQKR